MRDAFAQVEDARTKAYLACFIAMGEGMRGNTAERTRWLETARNLDADAYDTFMDRVAL